MRLVSDYRKRLRREADIPAPPFFASKRTALILYGVWYGRFTPDQAREKAMAWGFAATDVEEMITEATQPPSYWSPCVRNLGEKPFERIKKRRARRIVQGSGRLINDQINYLRGHLTVNKKNGEMTNGINNFLRRVIRVAVVVCPLFLVIMGGFWLFGLHEDFPEPSIWDAVGGFFLGFPALFATRFVAPFGLSQAGYVFVGVVIDGLFWAFVGVLIYSGLRSLRPRDLHH